MHNLSTTTCHTRNMSELSDGLNVKSVYMHGAASDDCYVIRAFTKTRCFACAKCSKSHKSYDYAPKHQCVNVPTIRCI